MNILSLRTFLLQETLWGRICMAVKSLNKIVNKSNGQK